MSKIKNGGLDHGAEPFEQQQFGTTGVEGVKDVNNVGLVRCMQLIVYVEDHSIKIIIKTKTDALRSVLSSGQSFRSHHWIDV